MLELKQSILPMGTDIKDVTDAKEGHAFNAGSSWSNIIHNRNWSPVGYWYHEGFGPTDGDPTWL